MLWCALRSGMPLTGAAAADPLLLQAVTQDLWQALEGGTAMAESLGCPGEFQVKVCGVAVCPFSRLGAPNLGSAERGHPDLFRFSRFLPICSGLPSLFSGIPRFVPVCSFLFRFVFRTNQNKSGNPLSADPFCKSAKDIRRIRVPNAFRTRLKCIW